MIGIATPNVYRAAQIISPVMFWQKPLGNVYLIDNHNEPAQRQHCQTWFDQQCVAITYRKPIRFMTPAVVRFICQKRAPNYNALFTKIAV
jgi:hypothetical protein